MSYRLSFAEADANLIAIELHDFATAIATGHRPEVDGADGLAAVAAVLGAFESGLAGRTVAMDDVIAGRVSAAQDGLDRQLGLLPEGAFA